MTSLRTLLFYLTVAVATVVVSASLLSLVHDVSYWYSKVLDFPRLQYLIVALASLLLLVPLAMLDRRWNPAIVALVLGLAATVVIQGRVVLPYLIGPTPVPDVTAAEADGRDAVGILIANVLVTNRRADDFLQLVRERDPDMVLVMEVDDWWMERLAPLDEVYAHRMAYPTDNAYGMALYSRFPLRDTATEFFNEPDVPSFHALVELPSARTFRFHGMHPLAPVPSEKYPDNQGEKEVAFGKLAELIAGDPAPHIVAGDYNDVSWSHTARLFQDAGTLANVRLGRGLYSSFDARSLLMRWPLDHFFVSREFALAELRRLSGFGSDHFPMYARFVLR